MPAVEISKLRKYYGNQRGTEDVTFNIEEGEIYGFIGPNGAGKTTTIRCMLSLLRPDTGTISIFGLDSWTEQLKIKEISGYVPGEVSFYDTMSVAELLHYSASFYKQKDPDRMRRLIDLFEVDTKARISELSLGNKKKVAIISSLLHRPKLIILDEATSGLDPLMQKRFFDLLRQEREQGATVLYSSHVLSEVKKLCDRVAIIRNGVVEEVSSVAAIQDKNYKLVTLRAREDTLEELDRRKSFQKTSAAEGERVYHFAGDVTELVLELGGLELSDLLIEDPGLEDIFLHYYEGEK